MYKKSSNNAVSGTIIIKKNRENDDFFKYKEQSFAMT
jgi:hypothetical protein